MLYKYITGCKLLCDIDYHLSAVETIKFLICKTIWTLYSSAVEQYSVVHVRLFRKTKGTN